MASVTLPVSRVASQVTLHVRIVGRRTFAVRVWAATQIMKLAAVVAGTKIDLSISGDFDEVRPAYRRFIKVGDLTIPTASSVREASPLYSSDVFEWGRKVDFFLDGVRQEEVVSFDLDDGWMRVFRRDNEGKPFVQGDEFATEILRGRIEVRPAA